MQPIIIFDMDGVLVDSEPFHKYIWGKMFELQGIQFTDAYYNSLIGTSSVYAWNKVIHDFNLIKPQHELMYDHKQLFYKELENYEVNAVPGIIPLLVLLKENKYQLSLGSSSPRKLIHIITERLNIKHYFDYLISSEDVAEGKPAPDIFLEVANNYKKEASDFIVIEDSKNGVRAAKAAGMKCIGYRNINSGNQDLSESNLIIESFSELNVQIIKEL